MSLSLSLFIFQHQFNKGGSLRVYQKLINQWSFIFNILFHSLLFTITIQMKKPYHNLSSSSSFNTCLLLITFIASSPLLFFSLIETMLFLQSFRKFDDPSLTYLAVNYLERFLSSEDMPQPKPWILKLISLSCVFLSAKMRKPDISVFDLPVEDEFFDAQMIERMENVILGALKWRMRSVTPFAFFDFFISLFELKEDPLSLKTFSQISSHSPYSYLQHDIKLLEFKPSVIAGAALLFASSELCPLQFPFFSNTICQCTYVNKDELMECYKSIQQRDVVEENKGSTETAVNVLDHQFSSCESDKSITITASSP